MTTPRLIVFDMAGTTVEDRGSVNLCFREALSGAELNAEPSQVDAVMGLAKPEAIRILIEHAGRTADLGPKVQAIHADFVARMIAFYESDPSVRAMPGIEDLFRSLRESGSSVALNTGFSRDITDVILRRLDWNRENLISASVTSDEVTRGRPHPDMIRHLMARLGVADPALVAKVGDAPADLLEGTNAGCGQVIGVTWGTHTRDQLETLPHTHLVDTLDELQLALQSPPRA
jgi:phosphonatase-like hydrolase